MTSSIQSLPSLHFSPTGTRLRICNVGVDIRQLSIHLKHAAFAVTFLSHFWGTTLKDMVKFSSPDLTHGKKLKAGNLFRCRHSHHSAMLLSISLAFEVIQAFFK